MNLLWSSEVELIIDILPLVGGRGRGARVACAYLALSVISQSLLGVRVHSQDNRVKALQELLAFRDHFLLTHPWWLTTVQALVTMRL